MVIFNTVDGDEMEFHPSWFTVALSVIRKMISAYNFKKYTYVSCLVIL